MFIVFGWNHQTGRDLGATMPATCPNCHNMEHWRLANFRTWFTLFFIPVIPYENHWLLKCPVCSNAFELHGADISKAKKLNEATQARLSNQISKEEYKKQLESLGITLPGVGGSEDDFVAELAANAEKLERDDSSPFTSQRSAGLARMNRREKAIKDRLIELKREEMDLAPLKGRSKGIDIVSMLVISASSAGAVYYIQPKAALFAGLVGCAAGFVLAKIIKLFMPEMCRLGEASNLIGQERTRLHEEREELKRDNKK